MSEQGHRPFDIRISVEKEASAHRTLILRAFLREHQSRSGRLPQAFVDFHAGRIPEPDWSTIDPISWLRARDEARALELGTPAAAAAIDDKIAALRKNFDEAILIGGPPCQAYSLVGRARAKGKIDYVPENDPRHYLFREYIRVLDRLRPAAFVMENVKGMLSSTVESRLVFEMLMEDLSSLGSGQGHFYELRAIRIADGEASLREVVRPADFVVRAEDLGVPQRRHRVIIVGIRSDMASSIGKASLKISERVRSVGDVIGNLPQLRSGLSRTLDNDQTWREAVVASARQMAEDHHKRADPVLGNMFSDLAETLTAMRVPPRASSTLPRAYGNAKDSLLQWLENGQLEAVAQHATREHMPSDLGRYMFSATFGRLHGYSPKASKFPAEISPDHRNWNTGVFNDRFRVQVAHEPSTTVTSHISKDGHYFIHPDASQSRSLTVREAARLQTFPDDYFFLGNRTAQYVQVGNAVPPYLARQIAQLLYKVLT
ncbi:DNA cytosine methyltransferase [Rhizobium leguminosarum]|nr:DNA cytosine methyltransferase [Rhizobium leguminosarum]UIK12495.1 DNA cytosine methyltransferase [Rhizobium leguminosarum]